MRTLLIFRGSPGCGKSTFIAKNYLTPYTLCPDTIRQQLQGWVQLPDGKLGISGKNEKKTWEILFDCLERRMQNGSFTVIDATSSKATEINKYKKLADDYKYRIFCVDMTDVPIDECKRRNRLRAEYKQVPDETIDKMYSRFATQKIPSGIKVIKPEELDSIWLQEFDLSSYKKICVIGDVHGCYSALSNYIGEICDDYFYIFVGDYFDRGIENAAVFRFIQEHIDKKNFLFLEGNHERHLKDYGENRQSRSWVFNSLTAKEFSEAGISRVAARKMYHHFGQVAWIKYGDKHFIISHGGLARCLTTGIAFTKTCTDQFITGVGQYADMDLCAESFSKTCPDNYYQIFGHRNIIESPVQVDNHNYCLEGQVEFGKYLRCVEISEVGTKTIETKNDVWRPLPEEKKEDVVPTKTATTVEDFVNWARKNRRSVIEKKFVLQEGSDSEGHISSFNFSRTAFEKGVWNNVTTRARGLFIDTDKKTVFARSYDKFFKTNEVDATKEEALRQNLKFPVTAYKKYNGYLLLACYNPYQDRIEVASKSTFDGPFAENGRAELLRLLCENGTYDYFKQYLKELNVTAVFEYVDIERDPHVVEAEKSQLILLDLVCNKLEFEKISYDSLVEVSKNAGIPCKEVACTFNSWREYYDFYRAERDKEIPYRNLPVSEQYEGYVLEDAAGFQWKLKSNYYNFWKSMRFVLKSCVKKGYVDNTSGLTTPLANDFYAFCRGYYGKEDPPADIISARKEFYGLSDKR